jgi:hypothetical protein
MATGGSLDKTGFHVARESLADVRDEAVRVLGVTRNAPLRMDRFDWLYRGNPDGEAILWSVRDAAEGALAGFTVALPRRIYVDGTVRRCWNCADFSMLARYRTLGLAIKLRRAARESVDSGEADFLYAHPNPRMQVIHEKVGHQPIGRMTRFAKLLRSGDYLKRRLKRPLLAGALSRVADPVLKLTSRERRHRIRHEVSVVSGLRFDERFDALSLEAATVRRVIGARDAAYLNWRYADNPLYTTDAVLVENQGRLIGYALFTVDDDTVHLKDLFPVTDAGVVRDLLARLIRACRDRRMSSISTVMLEGHPAQRWLEEFGFARRAEGSFMFGYAPEDSDLRDVLLNPASWFATAGDRDV